MSTVGLILLAAFGIALLLFLVIKTKLQAFLALLVVSYLVGLLSGMNPSEVLQAVNDGMGGTVAEVAVIIGVGSMFGEILKASGGAERLAMTLMDKFGEKRVNWALMLTGVIISIPVFLDVAFVILVPILYSLAQKTKKSLLFFAIPLLAGLAVTHSFVPPTPGPIAVSSLLDANLGWVILFGLMAGIPAAVLAGPVFGTYISKKMHIEVPKEMLENMAETARGKEYDKELPSFKMIASLILLPLVLILLNTFSSAMVADGSTAKSVLTFIGNPGVALTITALLTFYLLGTRRGYTKEDIQQIATKGLEPAGVIILITGAGGVFGEVLVATGIGDVIAETMQNLNVPIIVFAFIVASAVRIAQGSATVAMVTAASLISPVIGTLGIEGPMLALLVITIASGATIASHVNDSGFWMVSRFLGMSEKDTLKSWTVMETIIAFVGFGVSLIISMFI
ncbi:gluconate:H+ symporter, GntP family/Gnt-I system low-affinity gluconate transporter [Lentibacillus persicus]|uniref:Gluconate:H+ symporter, GntP family/Gnt-I system low-affinity gluconate transporter n=1 Tax=Lentibacillus persicus TaxID=640948 RepID=A0A1I1W2R4_9BACI|nr:gluconate:H+ symporter [Lentibacillus persicus]SFD89437.1 gluconate:H+ symporter, GntP family/Gnt-I system low-affinity gluconate transporter [Lentibacillus persicus]